MSNIHEQSIMPQGLSEEEIAALSDEEIMQMMIQEKRTRMAADLAQRMAGIRRRNRPAATRSK